MRTSRILSGCFQLALGSVVTFQAIAQNPSDEIQGFLTNQETSRLASSTTLKGPESNFTAVDPDNYYIGPGDRFQIAVVDIPSLKLNAVVDNRKNIYLPDIGLIQLGKVSLSRAQDTIVKTIRDKLKRRSDVYVALSGSKNVTVSINGAVANPGTRTLPGTSRLLDLIRSANGDRLPSLNDCNYREVLCSGPDSAYTVDLFGYLLRGDLKQNPYVYPGENIDFSFSQRRVLVNGPVKSSVTGWVPIRKDESIGDLLSMFKFDDSADTTEVVFQRGTSGEQKETQVIPWASLNTIKMQDRDLITIRLKDQYAPVALITVTGEVARPGQYPFVRGVTTIKQVIELAGGITEFADNDKIAVIRPNKLTDINTKDLKSTSTDFSQVVSVRPEMFAGMSRMNITLDYSVVEINSNSMALQLLPGDRVTVSKKDPYVYVSGSVYNPGAYPFVAGMNMGYYVKQAGGFTNRADRANIFSLVFYDGAVKVAGLKDIKSGVVIVVPDSQQAKMWSTVILPVLQVVLTTVSIVLAIYSVAR